MNKKLKQGLEWKGIPLHLISSRHNTPEFLFISDSRDSEPELGFDADQCIKMHHKFTWANIAASIGLFPSTSAAKAAGWNHPIEPGFNEAFFSKSDGAPLFVFILK